MILGTTQAWFLGPRVIASIILGPIVILYAHLFSVQQYKFNEKLGRVWIRLDPKD